MRLYSTNHKASVVSLKEAVFKGLPEDNGLYMPEEIPVLPEEFLNNISRYSFQDIAFEVSKHLIGDDVPESGLRSIIDEAINFEVPVVPLEDSVSVLELFHGPSLAFKDFGARFMARLMSWFLEEGEEINILVATSGDTGGAVALGFLDAPGIKVTILYPKGQVSELQEKQLTTLGHNITALEVDGTFDDCQKMVKSAFLDEELKRHQNLTSANSINISRLIPQTFYYFEAYARRKAPEKPLIFSVPSGNFGNLCGGLIAYRMGLPVDRFVAATNANDVFPKYLETGNFEPAPSLRTLSNAMDVGNPSNFARIQELFNRDTAAIKQVITSKSYSDEDTRSTIRSIYQETGYVMCPHTAIAYKGLKDYITGMDKEGIFLATAHPAKFTGIVEPVIDAKLEIPERLNHLLKKEKSAVQIGNTHEDLKNYLLESG